ncbi:uncharacterized protein N7500_000707 [Penicillium coprophilum]|uniref:uncharacterized protein n=1 Tax=Penicillium coprophilum TaxID=36646 RepID=UPI0023A05390|nr:uncharacterized protein N7500_000707 [Penicillium coprophilum]KAJ5178008.1 hypothetical protein N7500_000707 [Penicillium coprophilum]
MVLSDYSLSEYNSPHGTWHSNQAGLSIGPYGPRTNRETSQGYPAIAGAPPSRTVYRGSDEGRALQYVRKGLTSSIATLDAGDFHRKPKEAAYFTLDEDYADECARRGNAKGMVIQQSVPSRIMDKAYVFPEAPTDDWRSTVLQNRAQDPRPRHPPAVSESRRRDVVMGPIAQVETGALLRRTQKYRSGSDYESSFSPVPERSSNDHNIDAHRRGPSYVQQVRFQGEALDELVELPRHARPAKPARRRP